MKYIKHNGNIESLENYLKYLSSIGYNLNPCLCRLYQILLDKYLLTDKDIMEIFNLDNTYEIIEG